MRPLNGNQARTVPTFLAGFGVMVSCGLLEGCCSPPDNAIVDRDTVPIILQEAGSWCWAASGEMVLAHFKVPAPQCDQANKRFALNGCCGGTGTSMADPMPAACDDGGFPEFEKYGYKPKVTNDAALTWKQIKKQIGCRNQPIAFSWHEVAAGHMMVALEYQTDGDVHRVCRNDPGATTPSSSYGCLTYDQYVSGLDYTHWNDYYHLVKMNDPE
jgi:hypothetical protein